MRVPGVQAVAVDLSRGEVRLTLAPDTKPSRAQLAQAVRDSGLPCVEFVHRSDTCDNDKSVPTAIATHSTYLADEIRARFGRDCAFVSHPIDVKNYVAPEKLGTCIGAVTSYSSVKGLDLFIEAWAQIASEYPGIRLPVETMLPLSSNRSSTLSMSNFA
jgi:hypothetical protein